MIKFHKAPLQPSDTDGKKWKTALLTPYTGGNLGDAAIQEAVIATIKERCPDAELWLITLNPERTSAAHNISCFPVCGTIFSPYPPISFGQETPVTKPPRRHRCLLDRLKQILRRFPLLYRALSYTRHGALPTRLQNIFGDMLHIARAFRFMQGVSLLIVSGGGQLDDYWGGSWGHPYALFKWGLIATAVGAKYVVLSVGTRALKSRTSTFFVRQALRLATYRSYRDSVSKELLTPMVFTRNDPVYPDLAFSYQYNRLVSNRVERNHTRRVVGISPIAYLSQHGWPRRDPTVYNRYIECLISFICSLSRDYSVVLFSTAQLDRNVILDVAERLKKSGNLNRRVFQPRTETLAELFAQLVNLDFVVASRLHGVLLSHFVCIPVLAISYDLKVDTYMAEMSLSDYCVDIHNIEKCSLVETFQSLTANAEVIKSRLKQVTQDYCRALQHQYDLVLGRRVSREAHAE